MKKIKRPACIIMAVLVIASAPVTAYIQADAVEVVAPTMGILEAILAMFGVSVGLGNQSDYFSQSSFEEFSAAVSNGHVYHMDNYGDVDFSDDDSVAGWLKWANGIDQYLTASGNAPVAAYSNAIKAGAMTIDYASYKMTGTSATTAIHNYIDDLISTYGVSGGGTISLDARDTFSFFSGAGAGDNDDDDEESKKKRFMTRFKVFTAIAGATMLTLGDTLTTAIGLKHPDYSEFNEYDAAFEEGGFVPGQSFSVYHNSSVSYFDGGNYYVVGYYSSPDGFRRTLIYTLGDSFLFGIKDSDTITFYTSSVIDGRISSSSFISVRFYSIYKCTPGYEDTGYDWALSSGYEYARGSFLFPVFSSVEAFKDYCDTGGLSGVLNLKDAGAYADFKNNTASAAARLGKYLMNLLTASSLLKNLPSLIKPVLDTADASAGKEDALDALEDALRNLVPDIPVDPEPVPGPSEGESYFGILGQILTVLKNIYLFLDNLRPEKYLISFAGRFMTADSLERILTGDMPVLFAEAFAEALVLPLSFVIAAINALPESVASSLALPDAITGALETVFPRVDELTDAVAAFPDVIAHALEGVVIDIPDIVIPDIVIPEIVVPEIVIPEIVIPEIAVPDVNVELNPAYNITVANDFTGLGAIILSAVEAVLVKCFVPDEAAALEKFDEMGKFFKFKDDIIAAVGDLKTMLFGITPSPILKIPIGNPTSKKYNYGTGSYIIIDVSWYAQYKQLGDKIILAIAWALFLWRMFIKLPGIISGTEGTIVGIDAAQRRYEKIQSAKLKE